MVPCIIYYEIVRINLQEVRSLRLNLRIVEIMHLDWKIRTSH